MENKKQCNTCKEYKLKSEFGVRDKNKDGLQSRCKACDKQYRIDKDRTKIGLIERIYFAQTSNSKQRGHNPPKYTKDELVLWTTTQPNFERLYRDWEDSDYDTECRPSIDRLDDYKGYSMDNIQLLTWGENKNKLYKDTKEGINTKTLIEIHKYTLEGVYIESYHSASEAIRQNNLSSSSSLAKSTNKPKVAGGFQWSRVKHNKLQAVKQFQKLTLRKPVNQLDLNGNLIKIWDSAIVASKELNISRGSIGAVCKGKRKTIGGFRWEFNYSSICTQE